MPICFENHRPRINHSVWPQIEKLHPICRKLLDGSSIPDLMPNRHQQPRRMNYPRSQISTCFIISKLSIVSVFNQQLDYCHKLTRKLLILDPARHHAVCTQSSLLVFLIILEVAFKPFHMAIAFERQNMRGQAVEEHAIM